MSLALAAHVGVGQPAKLRIEDLNELIRSLPVALTELGH
jgi:hypothetical protein